MKQLLSNIKCRPDIQCILCGCWSLAIGALLGVSILMICIGLEDFRSEKLLDYQKALDDWKAVAREEFNSLSILPLNATQLLLKQSIDPLLLTKDAHRSLPSYDPLLYQETYPDVRVFGTQPEIDFDTSLNMHFKMQINNTFDLNVPLFQVRSEGGKFPSGCDSSKGYYEDFTCYTYWVRLT